MTLYRWKIQRNAPALLLSAMLAVAARAQGQDEGVLPLFLNDPSAASTVIARVGSSTITAQEFLISYQFGPAFVKREDDSRHRYLHYMILEKLLALDAEKLHLLDSDRAKQTLAEIEGDLATEELYRHDIAARVHIPDSVIDRGITAERITLSLRWLFSPTAAGISRMQSQLHENADFDTLFTAALGDSIAREDRSMEITKFRLGLRNPALSAIADTMKPGSVSLPIHAGDGWYIVKLVREWGDPVMTVSEHDKLREDVNRALVQHIADSLSDNYVNRLITGRRPVIIRRSFDILQTWLARSIVSPDVFDRWDMAGAVFRKWGAFDPSRIEPFLPDTLLSWSGGRMTVGEFVSWYHAREMNLKFRMTSPEAFFGSLEGYVWRMARDRFLAEKAFAENYQQRPAVRTQLAWWKDKIGYALRKESFADSIDRADSVLRRYYDENRMHYRDTAGVQIPFEQVRDDVEKDYYSTRLTALLLHRLNVLQSQYHVTIDEKALRQLKIDDENDPHSIEVYSVKTGGTFPRPAYPVIDEDWQGWK